MKKFIFLAILFSGFAAQAWQGTYSCNDGLQFTITNGKTNLDGVNFKAYIRQSNVPGTVLVDLADISGNMRGHICQETSFQH